VKAENTVTHADLGEIVSAEHRLGSPIEVEEDIVLVEQTFIRTQITLIV